jgi:hypothetical protein
VLRVLSGDLLAEGPRQARLQAGDLLSCFAGLNGAVMIGAVFGFDCRFYDLLAGLRPGRNAVDVGWPRKQLSGARRRGCVPRPRKSSLTTQSPSTGGDQ